MHYLQGMVAYFYCMQSTYNIVIPEIILNK